MLDLASVVSSFTYPDAKRVAAETLRQEFSERFPASSLASMTIEQYSLGLEPKGNSFCYWLEYKTESLGRIGGGSSEKFVVYFSKPNDEYKFLAGFQSKEQAFETVKLGLLQLLRLGQDSTFDGCDSVPPFENAPVVRGKILNMYFPDKFLPIFNLVHLADFCLKLEVDASYHSQSSMNQALLNFKERTSLFTGWTNDKFVSFLYDRFPDDLHFWKIAPGEQARLWTECVEGGFICIGWGEIGDMRTYTDATAFQAIYRELHGSNRQCNEIWAFAKELKPGDYVVANNGKSAIAGIGRVTGQYSYDVSREEYKHIVPVDWKITTEYPVPESGMALAARFFQGTLRKLSLEEYINLLPAESETIEVHMLEKSPQTTPPTTTPNRYASICQITFLSESFFADCEMLLSTKKQLILQGAPGTGKTFVAEQLAILWAGDQSRVKVVQFHESYGYEDFVHGIKPECDPGTRRTSFVPTPGIFLRLCEEIRKDTATPEPRYVLLIDEINRAKTARVFGELLYLLEYREKEVELQNGMRFSIPPNLYIIGTMNTTDKSIALVDYALRRRFAFVDLVPVRNGQSVVLSKWLESNGIVNAAEIDRLFVGLNNAIAEKDEALMVGHSYFMLKQALNERRFSPELLRFVWDYYILPLVAEYEYQLTRIQLEEKYGLSALLESLN